jgi:hypothetical protein
VAERRLADDITVLGPTGLGCPLGDEDPPDLFMLVNAYTFTSGAPHLVIDRAWALLHKLDRSELLTGTQLRHPDDSVEGQLWERKRGHAKVSQNDIPFHMTPVGWLVGWLDR